MATGAAVTTEIKLESFGARAEREAKAIVVHLRGNADMAVHDRLKDFLDSVGMNARVSSVTEVTFELGDLYFMNSTCLSLFLRFVNQVMKNPPGQPLKLRFKSNPNLRWQKRSLAALGEYAKELVIVE